MPLSPGRIRVLLADDEPALRGALAEVLGQEEHLALVGSAADALLAELVGALSAGTAFLDLRRTW